MEMQPLLELIRELLVRQALLDFAAAVALVEVVRHLLRQQLLVRLV
jgi:uncharacterized protein YggT (Ycf19 family)